MYNLSEKDSFARSIFLNLNKDITRYLGMNIGQERCVALVDGGFSSFRDCPGISCDESISIKYRKYSLQLDNIFKKFIADSDAKTQSDLDAEAIQVFKATQAEVKAQCSTKIRAHLVYKEVRRVMTLMLGKTVPLDLFNEGRFTEKASHSVTRNNAHLHKKLSSASCTTSQKELFQSLFGELFGPINYIITDEIDVSAVPKTFKTARTICPNTVIDGFLPDALGKFLSERLKDAVNIDIAVQQKVHRRLVKKASKDGLLTTLDLSKASDMFSIPFMRRVLPSQWYRLFKKLRVKRYNCDGSVVPAASFMSMGIGYTFPLQTMLFYAIVQSVKNLLFEHDGFRARGVISVYGDDCIFPTTMAPYVFQTMDDLGFIVNVDKTFSTGKFRESCGCDCYDGVDVRPIMLKWDDDVSFLENAYKFYNRFFSKHHECVFPSLKGFLLSELILHTAKIHVIPMDYPETSGIRVGHLSDRLDTYFGSFEYHEPEFYPELDLSKIDFSGPIDIEQIEMGWYFKCIVPPVLAYEVVERVEHWTYMQYSLFCAGQMLERPFKSFLLREQLHMFARPRPQSLSRPIVVELHPPEYAQTRWTKFRFRGKKYADLKRNLRNIARSRSEFISLLDSFSYGLTVPKKGRLATNGARARQARLAAGTCTNSVRESGRGA